MPDSMEALVSAVKDGRTADVRSILLASPDVKRRIDEPRAELSFDATLLLTAISDKRRDLIEVLLEAGASPDAPSGWWAGGFRPLHGCDLELAPFLIERGATVDVHAAARLGILDRLERLIGDAPELVHARGGDGQTPLHFASNVEVARFLLERGADIDALDVDHESTPAQWMVRDRPDVARFLVSRGARTDVLLTAALGDLGRTRQHLDRDPDAVQVNVSERHFPKRNPRSGGTIYTWTLGGYKTAHLVAREFGHDAVYRLLMDRSPAATQLVVSCWTGDDDAREALLRGDPAIASRLSMEQRAALAQAAERNDAETGRRMLAAGWPVDDRGSIGGTALHWAAWHGNRLLVEAILRRRPDLEARDTSYGGTPLGWAFHGSRNSWHCRTGDYGGTVEALLRAGAAMPPDGAGDATEPVHDAIRRHRERA
jgi:hypothetical protein